MKVNLIDVYYGRMEEVDKQIIVNVKKKQWSKVKELRDEKKRLLDLIKELEGKKNGLHKGSY